MYGCRGDTNESLKADLMFVFDLYSSSRVYRSSFQNKSLLERRVEGEMISLC